MLKKAREEYAEIFQRLAGEDVILYGTGLYARWLIANRESFPVAIVGVMDRIMTAGTFMGLPVVTAAARPFPCRHVVVAAAAANCGEILDRISHLGESGVNLHVAREHFDYIDGMKRYPRNPESMAGRDVILCGDRLEVEQFLKEGKRLPYTIIGVLNDGNGGMADAGAPVFDSHVQPFPCRHVLVAAPANKCEEIRERIAFLEHSGVEIHLPAHFESYSEVLRDNAAKNEGWPGLFDSPLLDGLGVVSLTDKSSYYGNAHDYLRKYEFFLRPYRDADFTLMELGVFKGSSLDAWKKYFTRAKLIGVDMDESARQYADSRVKVVIGDLGDQTFVRGLRGHGARVIVDDASHRWEHQLLALFTLYPAMPEKGIYILEDIETSFSPLCEEHGYRGGEKVPPFVVLQQVAEHMTVLDKNAVGACGPCLPATPQNKYEREIRRLAKMTDAVIFFESSCILVRK